MVENRKKRYFSLGEANAIITAIRPLIAEMMDIRKLIIEKQPEIWPIVSKAAGNGGSKEASEIVYDFGRLDELVREINATGAILKDINKGLIDFLSTREGRDIYLCWKYGEVQIGYWHEIDEGYTGRYTI